MSDRKAGLAAILKGLDETPPYAKDTSLMRRIEVQKLIYLVRESLRQRNMALDYAYNWYVRGPYAPALARDCYALDEARLDDDQLPGLKMEANEALAVVREVRDAVPSDMDKSVWLELVASLHYYAIKSRIDIAPGADLSDKSVREFIRDYKDDYTPSDVRQAWDALRRAGLTAGS